MREEYQYLSKLESVLKLRYEYNEARIQDELSKESIKKLNCALVTDHVVNENFTGIVKERLVEIKSIKNYHFSSIDQISQNFSSQSRKLESIWKKHLLIKNYVTNCKFFTGCEFFTDWKRKIKENEDKYHISISIEEVEKHHVWIAERIKEKKVLEKIAEDVSSLYEILNSLPIFKGLLASAEECERRIMMAKTIEEVEKHYVWVVDLIKEKKVLEEIAMNVQHYLSQTLKSLNKSYNNKWMVFFEKACANLKESNQIGNLSAVLSFMFGSSFERMRIEDILNNRDMSKYLYKDIIAIINEPSRLESQSELSYREVSEIRHKLSYKFDQIINIIKEPYPVVDFYSVYNIFDLIANVFLFFINIFLVFFIWPFIYLIRKIKKYFSIKKPVLDW